MMLIIGILAALLFPAIQKARLSAASAGCVSNLRTLASAHRMYEQEHDGKPPPNHYNASHPESEGHAGVGLTLLRRSYRPGPKYVWDADNQFIRESAEICPSVRINKLSINLKNGPDYDLSSLADKNYGLFYSKPSQRPLIWCGFGKAWSTSNPTIPLRHAGGINCAFLDGHIERISDDDGRLYHRWWYYAITQPEPDDKWLQDGTRMGVTELPK